jgi:DNA-binding MarR family transcriptional regulator
LILRPQAPKSKVEIELTEEEATAIRRILQRLIASDSDSPGTGDRNLYNLAWLIHGARQLRSEFFPSHLFGDDAWDMILSLYCLEGRGERPSLSLLGRTTAMPQTTALRWIQSLTDAGLIERYRDEHDRRRHLVKLTETARQKVTQYLVRVASMLFTNKPAQGWR